MAAPTSHIEHHPDLMALRARYDRASSTPMARAVEGLTLLAGLFLAISPWVVGFHGFTTLRVNNLILGLALAILALAFGSAYERTYGMGWVAAAIGIWTIIAPWVVHGHVDTTRTIASNVAVGSVALLLGLVTSVLGRMMRRSGGAGMSGRGRRSAKDTSEGMRPSGEDGSGRRP